MEKMKWKIGRGAERERAREREQCLVFFLCISVVIYPQMKQLLNLSHSLKTAQKLPTLSLTEGAESQSFKV